MGCVPHLRRWEAFVGTRRALPAAAANSRGRSRHPAARPAAPPATEPTLAERNAEDAAAVRVKLERRRMSGTASTTTPQVRG